MSNTRIRMTKRQAEAEFKEHVLPHVTHDDHIARWEAWNFYVDGLCRSGWVTPSQQSRWHAPRFI